jgi:uncharacterized protein GlcG (DUF336 family)
MRSKLIGVSFAVLSGLGLTQPALAQDVISARLMSLELANDIAMESVKACRELGYQVSVVVVDRSGIPQVVLRDAKASRFTTEIALKKANASILGGVSTHAFLQNRADISDTMNQLDEVLVLRGALPIEAAGSMIGAVGVSGALGGDKDEICAQKGLDAVADRLAFVE